MKFDMVIYHLTMLEQKKHDEGNGLVVLQYIQGTTEQLKRMLTKNKFKVAMKPMCTLRNQLIKPKDILPICKQTGVVYSIPC